MALHSRELRLREMNESVNQCARLLHWERALLFMSSMSKSKLEVR